MTRRQAVTLLSGILLLAGCAGPQAAVTIGGKTLPIDVAFGRPAPTSTSSSDATTAVPVPNGVGVLPVPSANADLVAATQQQTDAVQAGQLPLPPLPPPTPGPACPSAAAGASPDATAGPVTVGLPKPGRYALHFFGTITDDGATRTVSGQGSATVQNAAALPGGTSRFDVVVSMLGATTTFRYSVSPGTYTVSGVPTGGGLALTSASGSGGLGYVAAFQPNVPLQMFVQPAYYGASWSGSSTDAATGTVAHLDGTDAGKDSVDACGTLLDSWRVSATLTTNGPSQQITSKLETYVATQLGGLPIQQVESYTGTAGGKAVSGSFTWYFAQAPSVVE